MNFTKIKDGIKEAIKISGYSRTANELLNLSDYQLEDLGLSRGLLEQGYSAYPWRVEAKSQDIPDNVTEFIATKKVVDTQIKTRRPRAA